MNKLDTLKPYAPAILRLGLAGVVAWFGMSQILDQSMWTGFIPSWIPDLTGISNVKFVLMNGCFEVVASILLAYGFWVRPLAALMFLHMLGIVSSVGLGPTGMRDTAIAAGLLSVATFGYDILSWKYPTSERQS